MSAHDLERLVCERLAAFLGDQHELTRAIGKLVIDAQATAALFQSADCAAAALRQGTAAARLRTIAKLVDRIELHAGEVALNIDPQTMLTALSIPWVSKARVEPIELRCPATKVWHGRQLRLVIPGPADATALRYRVPTFIRLMAEVHEARQLVLANADQTISSIAQNAGRCRARLNELLRLACLSPEIVTAILEGRQPIELSNATLLKIGLPLDWQAQKALLGFA